MNRDEAVPGARVTWAAPHRLDVGELGTIMQPTALDLAEHTTSGYPPNRDVLVHWDRDPVDCGDWMDPAELRLPPAGGTS